mmetsp:Transcript_28829/g.84506  ORF Transcript_28829/g.84506 Transcript_28829/m.84506 type:complete len:327 (+) Transcript_28829:985-1965(+)
MPREDGGVDGALKVVHNGLALLVGGALALAVKDHGPAGPAQGLVRGGGHHVRVLEGPGHRVGRDEARDVRHVREEVRAHGVGDGAHAAVVVVARVGGGAGDEQLGADHLDRLRQLVVVDESRGFVEAVGEGLEVDGHGRHLLCVCLEPVAQVTAMGQVEAHEAIVRLEQRGKDVHVGRRPGEGLHVDAPFVRVKVERFERALAAHALCCVDPLVAAVVPRTGVALRVLVLHHRAQRLEHRARGVVLRRDEGEASALAALLLLNHVKDLGVEGFEIRVENARQLLLALHGGGQDSRSSAVRSSRAEGERREWTRALDHAHHCWRSTA